jgi:putative effector of murein hydrolase
VTCVFFLNQNLTQMLKNMICTNRISFHNSFVSHFLQLLLQFNYTYQSYHIGGKYYLATLEPTPQIRKWKFKLITF